MMAAGKAAALPEVYYLAEFQHGSISAGRHHFQAQLLSLILESSKRLAAGLDDSDVLARANEFSRRALDCRPKRDAAAYWIGTGILRRNPAKARAYFMRALRANPLHLKAIIRVIQTYGVRPA